MSRLFLIGKVGACNTLFIVVIFLRVLLLTCDVCQGSRLEE